MLSAFLKSAGGLGKFEAALLAWGVGDVETLLRDLASDKLDERTLLKVSSSLDEPISILRFTLRCVPRPSRALTCLIFSDCGHDEAGRAQAAALR